MTFLVESGITTCSPHERRKLRCLSAHALDAIAQTRELHRSLGIATNAMREPIEEELF